LLLRLKQSGQRRLTIPQNKANFGGRLMPKRSEKESSKVRGQIDERLEQLQQDIIAIPKRLLIAVNSTRARSAYRGNRPNEHRKILDE